MTFNIAHFLFIKKLLLGCLRAPALIIIMLVPVYRAFSGSSCVRLVRSHYEFACVSVISSSRELLETRMQAGFSIKTSINEYSDTRMVIDKSWIGNHTQHTSLKNRADKTTKIIVMYM